VVGEDDLSLERVDVNVLLPHNSKCKFYYTHSSYVTFNSQALQSSGLTYQDGTIDGPSFRLKIIIKPKKACLPRFQKRRKPSKSRKANRNRLQSRSKRKSRELNSPLPCLLGSRRRNLDRRR